MRTIAIDPALRNTGFAIIEGTPAKPRALAWGTIANSSRLLQSGCLVRIREELAALIEKHRPETAAVEGVIYVQSYRTAITLGAARGAALLALAERGLLIHEYAPRRVKQAIVGRGGADKSQVAFMVRVLFGLTETPSADAADALAIALTHLQASDPARAALPKSPTI